jgi:hypothetical protein
MWRSGSASPCQGEGREFESRHPLEVSWCDVLQREEHLARNMVAWPRGEAAACKAVHTGSNPVATSQLHAEVKLNTEFERLAQR